MNRLLRRLRIVAIGLIGSILLRIINKTLRWERVGLDGDQKWWADNKPSILVFWHGRQLFMPWLYFNHRKNKLGPTMTALSSMHADGQAMASALRHLGIKTVAGSSSKGGLRAIHALVKCLQNNSHVALTPDGPKGPPGEVKLGAIYLAHKTNAAIHPAAFAAEKYWQFASWDTMILPKPFSRAVLVKGSPIHLTKLKDGEKLSSSSLVSLATQVKLAIDKATLVADNYFKVKKS